MADVYLNSKFIGTVEDIKSYVEDVKDLRRKGTLPEGVNVHYDLEAQEIHLFADEGRARRPLIIVRDGKALLSEKQLKQLQDNELSWADLLRQGVIEYLDAGEEENALVAYKEEELTKEHTHLEISPGVILGLTTALVPFGNFNSCRLSQ